LPFASFAVTVMVEVPLPAVIGELAVTVDWAAEIAPALSAIVPDVAALSPVALKLSVRSPAVPLIDRLVKVATPPLFVVAVTAPPRLPPPVAMAAVTVTPAWLTALPAPSRSCTTGCRANVTPLCAVLDGSVVTVSWVVAPGLSVIVPDVAEPSPVAPKLSV